VVVSGVRSSKANAQFSNTLAHLERTTYEKEADVFVSSVDRTTNFSESQTSKGTVTVLIRNVTFARRIRWKAGDVEKSYEVAPGDTELRLPAGEPVTIFCEPFFKP
jgi:hypothetical protein